MMINQAALPKFCSDEDRAVTAALEVAAELSVEGQHFAAATVRVLVDYLARSRAEQDAMTGAPPDPAGGGAAPVAAGVADVPKAPGAKRGRPPKAKPPASPADVSSEGEPTGAPPSAFSTGSPPSSSVSPVEAVTVAEIPVAATAPAAVTA